MTVPYEEEEQIQFVQYLEALILQGKPIKFTAIPNSTYTASWSAKRKNDKLGLRPGLPDLFIIVRKRAIFIEMKRIKGTKPSPEQIEWINAINKCYGLGAYVCMGFIQAKSIIDSLLVD